MSLVISGLAVAALFTTTLFPVRNSIWTSLLIWVVRVVTISLLFRTFLGPFILRLLSNRLRVRSISLRSIKGIYFRSGSGILRIDRIGLSYHRPSVQSASRVSVKVEGLKLDITDLNSTKDTPNSSSKPRRTSRNSPITSAVSRRAWRLSCFLYTRIYTVLDPYVRPVIRTTFVSCLQFIIRALPALTQGLDFELNSASITLSEVPGVELVLGKAKLQTSVTLSVPPTAASTNNEGTQAETSRHRRFGSVVTWNARFASSVKRTWDRAWGATEVAATVSLHLQQITGNAYRPLLQLLNIPLGTSRYVPRRRRSTHRATEEHDRYDFLAIPHVHFSTSARLDPHKGVQSQSVDVVLGLDHVSLDMDVLSRILLSLKRPKPKEAEKPAPLPSQTPLLSPSPSLTTLAGWGSPLSAMSSNSQLMGVISASMRFRRHRKSRPVNRINTHAVTSKLAIMKAIHFNVATLSLKHRLEPEQGAGGDIFTASFQSISVNAGLSHPDRNPLHREWLGCSTKPQDDLSSDKYAICVSIREASLDRDNTGLIKDHIRVAKLGPIVVDTIISQYPSPWLKGPSFMAGDPNTQLVFVHVSLGDFELTERLEVLQSLLKSRVPSKPKRESRPALPAVLSPVPRIQFGLHLGKVRIRLISSGSVASTQPFALEARTDAFVANLSSSFEMVPDYHFGRTYAVPDHSPLIMRLNFDAVLEQTFLKVHTEPSSLKSPIHGSHTYAGEPILSLDAVNLSGNINTLGEMAEEAGMVVTIDVPSALITANCSTDALSIELWQPDAIGALSTVLRAFPSSPSPKRKPDTLQYVLDQLPSGLLASFSIGRATLYVTGPDLAPGEDLNISRGIASHTGVSLTYCAVRGTHHGRLPDSTRRRQRRLQLFLPDELISKAHSHLTSSLGEEVVFALAQVSIWDTALRDAVATGLAPDDPYGIGDSNQDYRSKEYLNIKSITADLLISGRRINGTPIPNSKDDCHINVSIPSITGKMHLAHVYNILLAANTLVSLRPLSASSPAPPSKTPSTLDLNLSAGIDKLQLLWDFPLGSQLYLRAKAISAKVAPTEPGLCAGWDSIVLATSVEVEGGEAKKVWEEVARLVEWKVLLRPDVHPVSISVEADTGRIRIPYGFVFADMILDVIATVKSIKHLVHMVPTGCFQDPPTPEAEEAKSMPDLKVRVRSLSAEVIDESIESRLGLIWKAGTQACRVRLERNEAFEAKAEAIKLATNPHTPPARVESDFQFGAEHTRSIIEAQEQLNKMHSGVWVAHFSQSRAYQKFREGILGGEYIPLYGRYECDLVNVNPPKAVPPMFRLFMDQLSLHLSRPSFPENGIPHFLFAEGGGLPLDTQYSLLVPMHINFTVASLRIGYRDYPLPMLNIPRHSRGLPSFEFDTDLVIAEEMGTGEFVERISCAIVKENTGIHGASPLSIAVPKTIMPVKTYANPTIKVTADDVTDLTWGVSYGPVMQDFMRVIDTLSHAPRDPSPAIGFWDKLRLVFHWRLQIFFDHEVHLHLKGSLSPYELQDSGAGFALCWRGSPKLLIGQANDQNEIAQLVSESMLITVPNVEESFGEAVTPGVRAGRSDEFTAGQTRKSRNHRKVCAKLTNGVRFGIGIALERSCGPECVACTGSNFRRQCRFFTFKPHYEVMLELKSNQPKEKSPEDSYNGFRSDFIHMSISLLSSLNGNHSKGFSSIHLSPKLFAHFWSWWTLFDGKALPIRQGSRYKHKRPLSPKFGQHLATIKYRISLGQIFISHAYMDNSREAWTDGVTPFVGVKAKIDLFQVDMHQRAQESISIEADGTTKTMVHKPFYAIEVVLKGLELRTLLAIFSEPLKQLVPLESSPLGNNYRSRANIPIIEPKSPWVDLDDFVEIGWNPESSPALHLLPAAYCPRFTYFRRAWDNPDQTSENRVDFSKFGSEPTHVCLLGKEASVPQVQIGLAQQRIYELRKSMTSKTRANSEKMITLLSDYMKHLHDVDNASRHTASSGPQSYYMPSDSVSPEDWASFNNVYQVHCPQIFLDNTVRDIMMQYYYCSRARRGFEYHMATRAVKFLRDQANTVVTAYQQEAEKADSPAVNVHAAAAALRKLLTGEDRTSVEAAHEPVVDLTTQEIDPTSGWSDGVSIRKGHFCLLLKPQIVLRSEASADAVCILAAVQGKLQSYAVMDTANADDPVSGKIMSRNYASITGLQTFSPSAVNKSGEGCVPLEVLIDLRCENSLFDRLVPQTDATFHYDKFNRLRLQRNVTSSGRPSQQSTAKHNHLQSQTDLIRFHVPRFTVSANDRHFQAISTIVTNLVLFSDAALKVRSDRLEKMLFSYDFTNMASAADVVENLQQRLRHAVEMKRDADRKLQGFGEEGEVEKLKIEAHILLLSEELDFVFEAINMAQDKAGGKAGQKSALLLHASSSEISWRMLDRHDQLLAKLALRVINFYWLSRQDSSTVNNLALGDLQAFDGAADAEWTEVLSKYEEKSDHPLVKKNLFLLADWTVLPPVGGITIYEAFDLALHPMRLQIDTRVGKKIMEYVWPSRRDRPDISPTTPETYRAGPPSPSAPSSPRRASLEIPSPTRKSIDTGRLVAPQLRRLGTSRSFTDLRGSRQDSLQAPPISRLHRTKSSDALFGLDGQNSPNGQNSKEEAKEKVIAKVSDDAAEMKTRSSQKTFVWVRVASLHLMLSIMKENSFLCRDARIRTRVLEYRNQTWSFEELVDQFIPSGRNWKGWVKMAFNQPLVPVLPVARELIAKTKWVSSSKSNNSNTNNPEPLKRRGTAKLLPFVPSRKSSSGSRTPSSSTTPKEASAADKIPLPPMPPIPPMPSDSEHSVDDHTVTRTRKRSRSRTRVLSLFKRKHTHESQDSRSSVDSDASVSTASSMLTNEPVPPLPVSVNQPGSDNRLYDSTH